jgi:predicted Rossmann fold flavoprotein
MDGKNQRQSAQPAKLAIVGGGAAGMFAAAVAAERGVPCVLVERKARLGSKVLMTANGRCNFAKDISPEQFLNDISRGGIAARCAEFVAEAVRECPPRQICRGFQSLGVRTKRMTDGRIFPADEKAATIVHAFGDLLRDEEVPIITNCPVKEIAAVKNGAARFTVIANSFSILAENVLLATGGASYPKTGSVGDGQRFAQALGHKLVPYRPGLIGLETRDEKVTRLAGRRFEDGAAKVFDASGRAVFEYRGEIDCERFGLSGAAIYNAQRFIEHYERERGTGNGKRGIAVEASFTGMTVRLDKINPRPLKEAIVTIGGVDTREIDPHTMQSKIVPGLYFAGEVMDIDGPTGGYNLTLAFATARKAVASIAKKEKTP